MANPRGTYLYVALALEERIKAEPDLRELPSGAELVDTYGVSRNTVLRALRELVRRGVVVQRPGARARVVRPDSAIETRPLAERLLDIIVTDGLQVGDPFPSQVDLAVRFGVARPTVRRALDKLEGRGLLSEGKQGRPRRVTGTVT